MRISLCIVTVLIVSSFMVSFIILTQPLGRCDPVGPPITGVDIEGAHIVSEGAYFRFWIFNNNSFSLNVTVNGADTFAVPPNSSVDYDVIAPHISVPYEQVTYKFSLTNDGMMQKDVDFTVLVLNSSFVQIFDLTIPILVTIAAIVVALIAIVIAKRRRGQKKIVEGRSTSYSRVAVCSILIALAAILCLVISFGLFVSGLEATSENYNFYNIWFNMKYVLLFEGTLGILCSAFSMITEVFVYESFLSALGQSFLYSLGSCFLLFQGLQVVELGVATSVGGGVQTAIIFGIPICVLSLLSLVLNQGFTHAMQ